MRILCILNCWLYQEYQEGLPQPSQSIPLFPQSARLLIKYFRVLDGGEFHLKDAAPLEYLGRKQAI
jgi:hypothetical protein